MLSLASGKRLSISRADAVVSKDLLGAKLDRDNVGRLVRNLLFKFLKYLLARAIGKVTRQTSNAYQVIVNTFVESPFQGTALPQLVVASVKALPVVTELSQAVSVDILDTIKMLAYEDVVELRW